MAFSTPCKQKGTECVYLIATNVRGCVPSIKVAVPEIELEPLGASTKMGRITRARTRAVAFRGSRSAITSNIRDITTP